MQAAWASRHLLACSGGLGRLISLPAALALFGPRIFSKGKKKKARPISIFNLVIQLPHGQVGTALAQEDEVGLHTGLSFPICGWVG